MADHKEKISYGFADKFGFTSPFGEDSIFSQQSREKEAAQRVLPKPAVEQQMVPQNQIKNDDESTISQEKQTSKDKIGVDSVFWKLGSNFDMKSKSEVKYYLLYDDDGYIQKYETIDNNYKLGLANSSIILPLGTRVAIISRDTVIYEKNFYRVILFWKGRYREGYIVKDAFERPFLGVNPHTGELFINDIERILWDIEIREMLNQNLVQNRKAEYKKYNFELKPADYEYLLLNYKEYILCKEAYDFVKKNLPILKKNIKQINFETLADHYYNTEEINNDTDYVTSLTKILNFLNIKFENFFQKKQLIILPFTKAWFHKYLHITTMALFNEKYISSKKVEVDFDLDVGAVLGKGTEDLLDMINLLEALYKVVINDKILKKTPEGKWLKSNILYVKKANNMLVLGTGAWKLLRWQNGASMVGLQNSFGNIYANPTITILLHEFDQGGLVEQSGYLPGDTHLDVSSVNPAQLKLVNQIRNSKFGEFAQTILYGQTGNMRNSDLLFACNSYHGIVFMEIFFRKYLKKYLND
jgi:hypothetical protein